MSKLAVALSLVSLVAAGGVVVLNAGLNDRIADLEEQVEAQAKELAAVERSTPAVPRSTASARVDPRVDELTERLAALESGLARPRSVKAQVAESGGASMAAQSAPSATGDTQLEAAVTAVLEAREEAKRQERIERMAEGRVRMLLRDMEIDDTRRAQVEAITLDHLVTRDARRDTLGDGDRDARRALEDELREAYRNALSTVLTATELESIESRLDMRRRGEVAEPGGRRGRRRPGISGRE